MKLRIAVASLLLAAFAAAQTEKKPEAAAKTVQPAFDFKAHMQKIMDAWSTLDPSNAAPFYSQEKGSVFYDIAPLKYAGWTAYSEGVTKMLADFSTLKITVGKDARVHPRGNLAWGTATWHGDAVMKNGAKESFDGRWTVIFQKVGDDWLIIHEHVSVPQQAAPPKK